MTHKVLPILSPSNVATFGAQAAVANQPETAVETVVVEGVPRVKISGCKDRNEFFFFYLKGLCALEET